MPVQLSSVTVTTPDSSPSTLAVETLATLTNAVQELALARCVEDVQGIVPAAVRRVARADGATFMFRDDQPCVVADEEAISPLWKGQLAPMAHSVGSMAMLNRSPVIIEDVYRDDRLAIDTYRSTFVKSVAMVPIRTMDPLGAIGVYWTYQHRATLQEIGAVRALADSTAVALEHIRVLGQLERTLLLSQTDALTGLPNRRAWDELLSAAVPPTAPPGPLCLAIIDIDKFKNYNDSYGHPAGDALLKSAGAAWRGLLRPDDIVARYGGEEFAVLLPRCDAQAGLRVADRLRAGMTGGQTASIGLAEWNGAEDGAGLVGRADAALYEAKHAGRNRVVLAQ